MPGQGETLTNQFFDLCRTYFTEPDTSFRDQAKKMGISHPIFIRKVKTAFKEGYLILRAPHAESMSRGLNSKLSDLAPGGRHIESYVVEETDDDSFAYSAAERVLFLLKEFLKDDSKKEVNLGLVSGTTTTKTFTQLVNGRFWEEHMHDVEIRSKTINIMALNISPVFHGEILSYNAVNTVLMLYAWLKEKLSGRGCKVIPYQLGSASIDVKEKEEEFKSNPANHDVLKYADPGRLDGSDASSRLDMVITSIGSPAKSLLQTIIHSLHVDLKDQLAGDLLFYPLDTEGKEIPLKAKDGKDYLVYSALRLETIRRMVQDRKAKIVLIARDTLQQTGVDKRKQEIVEVDKHKAILAATKGGYYNELITDVSTAEKLMRE